LSRIRAFSRIWLAVVMLAFVAIASPSGGASDGESDPPPPEAPIASSPSGTVDPTYLRFRPHGEELQVNSYTTGHQESPSLTFLPSTSGAIGEWQVIVVFQGKSQTGSDTDLFHLSVPLDLAALGAGRDQLQRDAQREEIGVRAREGLPLEDDDHPPVADGPRRARQEDE